jgi:hypothetical protein
MISGPVDYLVYRVFVCVVGLIIAMLSIPEFTCGGEKEGCGTENRDTYLRDKMPCGILPHPHTPLLLA